MQLIYFLAGVLATILFLYLDLFPDKNKTKPKGKWSKIESVEYTYDVDHSFKQSFTGQEMLYVMSDVMKNKIESDCGDLKNVVVEKGDYSINCFITLRFTKREPGES